MADRLVDLQDHLVRRQQHVHLAARAVRRRKQFERFQRDPVAAAHEGEPCQHFGSTLLARAAIAVERANLRDAVRMGRDGHSRQKKPVALDYITAGAGDQPVRGRHHIDGGLPVDDPRVASSLRRFLGQQFVPLATRRNAVRERWRHVLAAWRGPRQRPGVEQRQLRGAAGPVRGALERLAQAVSRDVTRRRVAVASIDIDRCHRAAVGGRDERHRDVLAHREGFAVFRDEAQRPEIDVVEAWQVG
jgi:hypothetical protein